MTPSPKKLDARAKDLFAATLEKPASERAAFLASACGGDVRLQAELMTLLRGFDAAEQRFEEQQAAVGEQAGDRIGHYKLLQKIGEGGFGVVWMAEQEEPVRRKVALKVLKAGMDTAQVVARFEAERQALALMDHPHIAKVFDGGATATGRPYFVMELVKGVPITQFCDDAGMGMVQRLELFVPVCQAVQHAHQKGVIHRDLKPSNVLVALHDGAPVCKVIDFGIAKATAGSLTQKTVFTEFRQMLGTPEYMAPEQAELSSLDVDTRADIYSLGVLLYELLTGTRPFELKTLLQAGYAEMLRTIKEVDPPKPSTRISTLGEAVTDIARHRRVSPKGLGSSMRGDLDWIVMKALEKERSRRYDTATALAEDVLRHLRHEPVLASPPSRLYRWRKYARRHRVGFAATAAIAVSLLAGAIVSTFAYLEADVQRAAAVQAKTEETRQKDAALAAQREADDQRRLAEQRQAEAQREAKTAKTVTELLTSMLASSDPHQSKDKDYKVRQVLDDFDRSLGDRLVGEPEIEAEVRGVMSDAYQGLGLPERAEPHAQRSLELNRGLHGERSIGVVQALFDLVSIRHQQLRIDEALLLLDQAAAAMPAEEPASGRGRIKLLGWRSDLLRHRGDLPESEKAAREGLQLASAYGDEARRVAGMCFDQLGLVLSQQGRFAEAETYLREQVVAARARWGEHSPHVATALRYLARGLEDQGRHAEAEGTYLEAVSILEATWGREHREVADCLRELADVKNHQLQNGEAEALRRRVLRILRASEGDNSRSVAETLRGLAFLLVERKEFAEAAQCCEQALAAYERVSAPDRERVYCLWLLASAQLGQGMEEQALATLPRARAAQQALPQGGNGWAIGPMEICVTALVDAGRYAEGDELAQQVIRLYADWPPRERQPPVLLRAQSARGIALQHLGRLAEAEELQRRHIVDVGAVYGEQSVDVAASMHNLACTLRAQQRYQEATQWHEKSLAIHRQLGKTGDALALHLFGYGQTAALAGDLQQAERLYEEARSLWAREKGESCRDVAMCWTALGVVVRQRGDLAAAEQLQRRALAMLVQVQGPEHLEVADAQVRLAQLIERTDRHAEACELLQKALAIQERKLGAENLTVALTCGLLARSTQGAGDLEAAERLYHRAMSLHDKSGAKDPHEAIGWLAQVAGIRRERGDPAASETLYRQALGRLLAVYGEDHPEVGVVLTYIAQLAQRRGDLAAARDLLRRALPIQQKHLGEQHLDVAQTLADLAITTETLGDAPEAEALLRRAIAMREKLSGEADQEVLHWLDALNRLLFAQRRFAESVVVQTEAIERMQRAGNPPLDLGVARQKLASALSGLGQAAEAEPIARAAVATLIQAYPEGHANVVLARHTWAIVLMRLGRHAEAEEVLWQAATTAGDAERDGMLAALASCLLDQDKGAEAEPLARECLERRAQRFAGQWQHLSAMGLLGGALVQQGKLDEAEPLLQQAAEKLPTLSGAPPLAWQLAWRWSAKLCEARGRTAEAAQWRERLAREEAGR